MKPKRFININDSYETAAARITACGEVFARTYAASLSCSMTYEACRIAATDAVEHFVKVITEEVY